MSVATLYSYSVIYVTSPEFQTQIPYVLALLESQDGKRFLATSSFGGDLNKLVIGKEVSVFVDSDTNKTLFEY